MLKIKQGTQIEKLGFDEYTYKVKFKNSPIWSIYVSRVGGAITLLKSGISPESVDRFEARRNDYKSKTSVFNFLTLYSPSTPSLPTDIRFRNQTCLLTVRQASSIANPTFLR